MSLATAAVQDSSVLSAYASRLDVPQGRRLTDVGMIPEDWKTAAIGDLRPFVTSGSRGWARFYCETGARFIRISNLSRESIYLDLDDLKFVRLPDDATAEAARTLVREGDLLISITADIGIVGFVDQRVETPAYINQHIALVRFRDESVVSRFAAYFLASEGPQRLFIASMDIGAKAGMNLSTVRKLRLVLPPPPEQCAIVEALSNVDELLGSLEKLIAKNRAVKHAAMQQLLTGKTRLPGFGRGIGPHTQSEVPSDWRIAPLCSVSSMHGRIGWQGLKQAEFTTNASDPFLITGIDFRDSRIDWDSAYHVSRERYEVAPQIQLRPGDVLMTKDGTIGKLLYVETIPNPGMATLNSHLLVFRPINGAYLPRFLFYQLASRRFADHVEQHKSGSTFFGLSQAAMGRFMVLLPPIDEQRAIATALADMDAEISALEARRDKTQAIKRGMMQQLLTGRIRFVEPCAAEVRV
jgi:type I restriction enzyme S subunit